VEPRADYLTEALPENYILHADLKRTGKDFKHHSRREKNKITMQTC